jgi:hypothetical protein
MRDELRVPRTRSWSPTRSAAVQAGTGYAGWWVSWSQMTAESDEWAAEARDRLPAMIRTFVERNLPEVRSPT